MQQSARVAAVQAEPVCLDLVAGVGKVIALVGKTAAGGARLIDGERSVVARTAIADLAAACSNPDGPGQVPVSETSSQRGRAAATRRPPWRFVPLIRSGLSDPVTYAGAGVLVGCLKPVVSPIGAFAPAGGDESASCTCAVIA
ncbi:hypothetical protein [Actinomadura geliboluensis]|uniref:Uncharacterized protein n=1 Tax=Actinomadura geliboluensis TaxID=882440 RepID=A0A5S4FV02_9ACTN|nr:hypothetical protein [Actinomadura geliboluensis]TMR24606.1 hypothetical protein ETD96_43030 [Actinomadura geliboluensis]